MGYAPGYFDVHVARWIDEGWLPVGGAVADLGAAEFDGDPRETRDAIRRLLGRRLYRPRLVGDVYRALGYAYEAFDVDGRFGSRYLDLNIDAAPDELRGSFDIVNDEGTIEHLANPINGFRVAHDLARVGGVIRHSMPVSGWLHHGLFHPTLEFWVALVAANDYELLESELEVTHFRRQPKTTAAFDADHRRALCDVPGMGLDEFFVLDTWAHITYRKTREPFAIPVDHVNADEAVVERLRQAYPAA